MNPFIAIVLCIILLGVLGVVFWVMENAGKSGKSNKPEKKKSNKTLVEKILSPIQPEALPKTQSTAYPEKLTPSPADEPQIYRKSQPVINIRDRDRRAAAVSNSIEKSDNEPADVKTIKDDPDNEAHLTHGHTASPYHRTESILAYHRRKWSDYEGGGGDDEVAYSRDGLQLTEEDVKKILAFKDLFNSKRDDDD
jgi:hypothetical protein